MFYQAINLGTGLHLLHMQSPYLGSKYDILKFFNLQYLLTKK